MRLTCCLCGRPTEPAAMIGNMAVGPKCARRAGLFVPKRKGSVIILKRKRKEEGPETIDMFDNLEEYEE
jgi:hypothetical protein